MNYSSEELNKRISKIADNCDEYEAFGEKAVPYIGWYWRDVDFDYKGEYTFGILPIIKGFDGNDKIRVGFMENNKWGYDYVSASADEWEDIKELVNNVVSNTCYDTLKILDDKIQSLLKNYKPNKKKGKRG